MVANNRPRSATNIIFTTVLVLVSLVSVNDWFLRLQLLNCILYPQPSDPLLTDIQHHTNHYQFILNLNHVEVYTFK